MTEFSPALLWLQRTTETSMIQPTVTPPPAATATNLHIHSSVLKQQKQVSVLLLTTLYENQEDITRIQKTLYCHCLKTTQRICVCSYPVHSKMYKSKNILTIEMKIYKERDM